MQKPPNTPIRLALVAYPGAQRAALEGLADLFALLPRLARGEDSLPGVEIVTVSEDHLPEGSFDALLFPPSLEPTRPHPDHPLCHWARAQHATGALAASVCAGAFWLGHAGLLDNRPATTHWALEPAFRACFPLVDLQPEHILIDDLDIVTAGGLMAWLDLGLHLTGLWFGPDMVSRLARHLLVDPAGREQRHYSGFRPPRDHGDAAVLRVQRRIDTGYAEPLGVTALATHAGLSERSLLRRFQAATGLTPAAYLQRLRVEKARGALERSADSTAEVAWAVGYRDASAFSRAFKGCTGLTPGVYRARFRVGAKRPVTTALCEPATARI
ncbi:MAG: helix-turn-helix domain-containing protein [Antarcticimicrobium sp.]|uniref:GlxA family transcriptional regulator n=1 Tax=Antarcticimicrobium sp. TaxID=2824147 RepID=UPI00260F39D4|nr:helix-turn-helix domain-containing protein [Antarcticimicrobium sp.]MDF1717804.1 helix-turn-helix domain-containing protein [Antarcticimicrobium sp.]